MSLPKILFVHGRPSSHPLHTKYGKSITEHFSFEDPLIRWHDRDYPSLVRYFAWMVNAFAFVSFNRKIIVTEGFRFTLVLSKLLSFNRIKLIMLVDDESPYFLYSKYYKGLSYFFKKWGYNQYDAYLCIGEMEAYLVRQMINSANKARVVNSINGLSEDILSKLSLAKYNPKSMKFVFIGNGPSPWRMWYKGVDLMVETFSNLALDEQSLNLEIAGEWDSQIIKAFAQTPEVKEQIILKGYQKDIAAFLEGSLLYLHMGRGEAWGISIMEAMAAGVVPLISEWTGAKECVTLVSERLVVPLDREEIVNRMKWFLSLSDKEKIALSNKCKEVASRYTEEKAIKRFQELFLDLVQPVL